MKGRLDSGQDYWLLIFFWIGAMLKTPRHEKTLVHFNFTAYTPNPPKKNQPENPISPILHSFPSFPSSPWPNPSPTFSSHKVPTGTVKFRLAEVTFPGEEKPATSKRPTWRQQATAQTPTPNPWREMVMKLLRDWTTGGWLMFCTKNHCGEHLNNQTS